VPGAPTTESFGINDGGQIVGVYLDGSYGFQGFLASSVPEPSTLVLLLTAAPALLALRLGRRRVARRAPPR
jgi:hypothetical protein